MMQDTQRILTGKQPTKGSANTIKDVPHSFKSWIENHSYQIEQGKSLPYFVRDNMARVKPILSLNQLIKVGNKEWTLKELISECHIEPTENGKIYIHPSHGKNELSENLDFARWRAEQFGEEVILLPNPQNVKSPDSYNITRGVKEEYKKSTTPTKNSISQLIRDGKDQSDYLIIEINPDMKVVDVFRAFQNRITDKAIPPRCTKLKEIRLKIGVHEAVYSRKKIVTNGFKIKPEDFHNMSAFWSEGSSLTAETAGSISDAKLAKFFGLDKKTPKEIAVERHAKRNTNAIQQAWNESRIKSLEEYINDGRLPDDCKQTLKHLLSINSPEHFEEIRARIATLQKTANRHKARTPQNIADIKERWAKKQLRNKTIRTRAENILAEAKKWSEVDFSTLEKLIADNNLTKMREESMSVIKAIRAMRDEEKALADLIPNTHELHQQYTLAEMKKAFKELDGVMQKWLTKYSYSSLDAAPLLHLKNKLDFELTSPTIRYKYKDIIQKALTEKKRIVEQKIEWEALVAQASSLRSFKTKSTVYKGCINKIDLAIQQGDFNALKASIAEAERQQQKLTSRRTKIAGDTKTALNEEYKGTAVGSDITTSIDVRKMTSEDPYRSECFTNNIARIQGFDNPAKLVTPEEFARLEKECEEVFFRTVNDTNFKGKRMTSAEFASQLYKADKMELNGPGGRVYGDGMYVATSSWDGRKIRPLTPRYRQDAYDESRCYGNSTATIYEMTFVRKPRIIKQEDLSDLWDKLTEEQQEKFGDNQNTFGCALGYDAMYCNGPNYWSFGTGQS